MIKSSAFRVVALSLTALSSLAFVADAEAGLQHKGHKVLV